MTELHKNLIDGEWVGGEGRRQHQSVQHQRRRRRLCARDRGRCAKRAIAAAKAAFPAWSRSGMLERHAILRKASRRDPRAQGRARARCCRARKARRWPKASARRCAPAQIFDFFAGEALRLAGETRAVACGPGVGVEITREPVGVVGIITPWNFPIAIPGLEDRAGALPTATPSCSSRPTSCRAASWAIVDILHRAGLPKGVLNLVMGKGSVVGQAMLDSPDVDAITFTGSVGTGKRVAAASRRADAQVPARDGRQEPARRARRCRSRRSPSSARSTAPSSRPASAARRRRA